MTTPKSIAVELENGEQIDWSLTGRTGATVKNDQEFKELFAESQRRWAIGVDGCGLVAWCGVQEARFTHRGLYIWILPTLAFERRPLRAVRACRYWLDELMSRFDQNLWCYVDSTEPDRLRLVKLLGFDQTSWHFVANSNVHFIYERV